MPLLLQDLPVQAAVQDGFAGLFGMIVFGVAVNHFGPSATALSGAGVSAATALGGWFLLGEAVMPSTAVGIVPVVLGLAAHVLEGRTR